MFRRLFLTVFVWFLASVPGIGVSQEDVKPSVILGAGIFKTRCVLCHGNEGYGDGTLPLTLKNYPSTNLHESRYGKDMVSLRNSIIYGGSQNFENTYTEVMSNEMPPWGNELTYTQVESVVWFVRMLLTEPQKARELLKQVKESAVVSVIAGKVLYKNYCSLCHGVDGEGNGQMATIMKDPSPVNLTASRITEQYMRKIIDEGGAAMGRSPRMPPWKQQLTDEEVSSIILYIKTLRINRP